MIKNLFAKSYGEIPDTIFNEILSMTTQDLKANNINFAKRTNLNEVLDIMYSSYIVLKRIPLNYK